MIRRFGGALNLNVHFHALVRDGVFAGEAGNWTFHPVVRLTALDVEEVLAAVEPLGDRRVRAHGVLDDDGGRDPWTQDAPLLAGLAAASVQGVNALAPRVGRRPARLGNGLAARPAMPPAPDGCGARANGYSLHAGVVVPAGHRDRLERVCRYVLRPPVATDRLRLTEIAQFTSPLCSRARFLPRVIALSLTGRLQSGAAVAAVQRRSRIVDDDPNAGGIQCSGRQPGCARSVPRARESHGRGSRQREPRVIACFDASALVNPHVDERGARGHRPSSPGAPNVVAEIARYPSGNRGGTETRSNVTHDVTRKSVL